MRRWFALLLVLLMLLASGCAEKVKTLPLNLGRAAQVPPPARAKALEQVSLPSGQTVDISGLFFMNTKTGALEGWTHGGAELHYEASHDNRWVIATAYASGGGATIYLADRKTGAQFQWDAEERRLLSARGGALLFASAERVWLADESLRTTAVLTVKPQEPAGAIAPDGKSAMLASGGRIYHVAVPTGKLREVGTLPPDSTSEVSAARGTWLQEARVLSRTPSGAVLQRFTWAGEVVGEIRAPVGDLWLSPDGKLVAWESALGPFPAVIIADAASLEPKLRVRSATLCSIDLAMGGERWRADGQVLVLRTDLGWSTMTLDGTLALRWRSEQIGPWYEIIPAPGDPQAYAVARSAVWSTDSVRAAAVLNPEWKGVQVGHLDPWGAGDDEIRFSTPHGGHGGRCNLVPVLPARAEPWPFRDEVLMTVDLPVGDCLNLRRQPGMKGEAISCLPGGTRMTLLASPIQLPVSEMGPPGWIDGHLWRYVRVDGGLDGWVALTAGGLNWAEPGGEVQKR